MKTNAGLAKYFKKKSGSVISFFNKPAQGFSFDDFHDLRVEIKKVKAILRLANFCNKNFNQKKYFSAYKEIFKQAGKMREMQIEETALKKYKRFEKLKTYSAEFKKVYEKEAELFSRLLKTGLKDQIIKNENDIYDILKNIDRQEAEAYMKQQRKKINRLLLSDLKSEKIHDLRIRLKDYWYIIKIYMPKKEQSAILEKYQQMLGSWHDHSVIVENLQKKIDEKNADAEELKSLDIIRKRIAAKTGKIFNSLIEARSEILPEFK